MTPMERMLLTVAASPEGLRLGGEHGRYWRTVADLNKRRLIRRAGAAYILTEAGIALLTKGETIAP